MKRLGIVIGCMLLVASGPGCSRLKEVRSKTKFGPSFRHKGSKRTDSVRWTVQQGFDFKWKGGVTTGVSYRRRDTDAGTGDSDNGVFFSLSFPVWEAPKKPGSTKKRLKHLEKRVLELEKKLAVHSEG